MPDKEKKTPSPEEKAQRALRKLGDGAVRKRREIVGAVKTAAELIEFSALDNLAVSIHRLLAGVVPEPASEDSGGRAVSSESSEKV